MSQLSDERKKALEEQAMEEAGKKKTAAVSVEHAKKEEKKGFISTVVKPALVIGSVVVIAKVGIGLLGVMAEQLTRPQPQPQQEQTPLAQDPTLPEK